MYKRTLAVMLIDDDADDYLIVRDLLAESQRSRIRLDWASSFAEGAAALAADSYHAYLIDYHLGAQTGLELIEAAVAAGCSAPLILLTGQDDDDRDMAALAAGASDFLVKSQLTSPLLERTLRYAVERAVTTAALRASNERYRMVAETATDAILTVDEAGTITFANLAAEQIFGYRPAELVGQPLTMLMPEGLREQHLRGWGRVAAEAPRHHDPIERPARHRSGRLLPVEVSVGVGEEGGKKVFTAVLRDVSERKRLEEELRQAQKMEAIGRLAGGVAHDFNNVLTAITGYGDMLLSDLAQNQTPQRGDIEQILGAARRAASLTQQLLAFSRKQMLQPEVLDLNVVIADMEPMLRRLIGEDVLLSTDLAPGSCLILVDPGQIQQVIMNLAVNARDAMPRGGKLSIATGYQGGCVALTVSDSGQGMDAETRRRAFEPFFTTKERGKGTGLGLSTVYGIVTQSGGEVSLESTPGSGARFTILLPQALLPGSAAGAVERPARLSGSETVLLVEDDQAVRGLIESILRIAGYAVLGAASGHEALERAQSHQGPIHLLISDVIMPGMSGVELVGALGRLRPEMRVLYISGYTDDALGPHGLAAGGLAFLSKPFHPDELTRKVRAVLDSVASRTV